MVERKERGGKRGRLVSIYPIIGSTRGSRWLRRGGAGLQTGPAASPPRPRSPGRRSWPQTRQVRWVPGTSACARVRATTGLTPSLISRGSLPWCFHLLGRHPVMPGHSRIGTIFELWVPRDKHDVAAPLTIGFSHPRGGPTPSSWVFKERAVCALSYG